MAALLNEILTAKPLPSPAKRRAIREAAGVSRARFGKEIGVTGRTIVGWELGTVTPRPRHYKAYADLLHALDGLAQP